MRRSSPHNLSFTNIFLSIIKSAHQRKCAGAALNKKYLYLFLAGCLLGFLLSQGMPKGIPYLSPSDSSPSRKTPAVKVITRPVMLMPNDKRFQTVGTGVARLSAQIYSPVSEEVRQVLFKAGTQVAKGDLLVRLDNRNEILALKLAKVRVKDTKSLLGRYEQAVKDGAVPQSEVDEARADYEGALVELEQAELALRDREILAPFDGVVGIPNIDPGDRIDSGTLITQLDDRSLIFVDFDIPESLAGPLLKKNAPPLVVTAKTPAFPEKTFQGEITAEENQINEEKRTLRVRATIENVEDLLRPGMSFETTLLIEGNKSPTIPEISLQWEKEGPYVWKIKDETAHKIRLRVIGRKGGNVLVEGDLNEGDTIVVEGVQRLRENQEVEILGQSAS